MITSESRYCHGISRNEFFSIEITVEYYTSKMIIFGVWILFV